VIFFLLWSCTTAPPSTDDTAPEMPQEQLVSQDGPRLLRRMSLDLRGVLPSLEELEAVESDPSRLESLRDAYLEDERFAGQLVYLLAERWHTLAETYNAFYYDYHLDVEEEYTFKRSVGAEPLRLMARVAVDDLPWTQIVTSDTTMANALLNEIWELEGYPEDGVGWHPVRYTDDRPAAGVLSTNGLWWKYTTTSFNQNRSRAAAVSRLLLCEDLLNRPVEFEVSDDLLESDDVSSMVRSEPGCLACHSIIEPLAASLYGFLWVEDKSVVEMEAYHPEREILGPIELDVGLSYWGDPISGLEDLGRAISRDPRFSRCAVRGMTGTLLRRELELEDHALLDALHQDFQDSDLRMKALIRQIMDTEAYRAAALTADASEETADRELTVRLMGPPQLASTVEELTGFSWVHRGERMMDADAIGYRVLAGGVDGEALGAPQQDPGLTWALVIKRLAESSSMIAVGAALDDDPETVSVLSDYDLRLSPDDAGFDEIIDELGFRLLATRLTAEERLALADLWLAVQMRQGPEQAWAAVFIALLRDPLFVSY
jgi:hypothetical protein